MTQKNTNTNTHNGMKVYSIQTIKHGNKFNLSLVYTDDEPERGCKFGWVTEQEVKDFVGGFDVLEEKPFYNQVHYQIAQRGEDSGRITYHITRTAPRR